MAALFDAVLFDFDGVLADSEGLHYQCWTEILTPLGIPLSWDEYRANCIGITDRDMIEVLCKQVDPPYNFENLWSYYPQKKQLFRNRSQLHPPIELATREFVLDLAAEYKLAVVSSSGRAEVEPVLERAGILGKFQTVITGDDVQNRKPHPEPYLLAAERIGARRPLVVEDSEPGAASGLAAGFEVVRLLSAGELPDRVAAALGLDRRVSR